MAGTNDRVCVSRYYPVEHIKANRMYIVRYSNSLFIANGNIYVQNRKNDDEIYYCCTINNFKKWGGIENLKRFITLKEKREVKTITDLMYAVIECGYSRELDYFEYMEAENDSLLENSDYKYNVDDFTFQEYPGFSRGFKMNGTGFRESGERIFHDGDVNFSLDLCVGGIRKDLPACVLKEIEREANELLEVNFVRPEDIKNVKFTCFAKVKLSHGICKNGSHVFDRSYSIHIGIDRTSDYYDGFELDDLDLKFLKHAGFCLCDIPALEKPFDEFIRNEMFH